MSVLTTYPAVAGAVGKWESRGVCGISKRGGKVGFMTFPARVFFHSPSRRHFRRRQCRALRRVPSQTMRSVREAQGSIQMLMHPRLAACQGRSPAYLLNLQAETLKAHRVVAIHRALELQREDQVQI